MHVCILKVPNSLVGEKLCNFASYNVFQAHSTTEAIFHVMPSSTL